MLLRMDRRRSLASLLADVVKIKKSKSLNALQSYTLGLGKDVVLVKTVES